MLRSSKRFACSLRRGWRESAGPFFYLEERDPDTCEHGNAAEIHAHVPGGIPEWHGFAGIKCGANDIAGGPCKDAPEGEDGNIGHVGKCAKAQGPEAEVGGCRPMRFYGFIGDFVPDGDSGEAPAQPEQGHGPCRICEDKEGGESASNAWIDGGVVDAAQQLALRMPRGEVIGDRRKIRDQRAECINGDSEGELRLKPSGGFCDEDAAGNKDKGQPDAMHGEVGHAVRSVRAWVGCDGHRALWLGIYFR